MGVFEDLTSHEEEDFLEAGEATGAGAAGAGVDSALVLVLDSCFLDSSFFLLVLCEGRVSGFGATKALPSSAAAAASSASRLGPCHVPRRLCDR